MLLFLHVAAAFAGIAATIWACLLPSRPKLTAACILLLVTLASGTYLILSKPTHLMEACAVGLLYTTLVGSGIGVARARFAKSQVI